MVAGSSSRWTSKTGVISLWIVETAFFDLLFLVVPTIDFRVFLRVDRVDTGGDVVLSGCIGVDEMGVSSLGALLSDAESS